MIILKNYLFKAGTIKIAIKLSAIMTIIVRYPTFQQ